MNNIPWSWPTLKSRIEGDASGLTWCICQGPFLNSQILLHTYFKGRTFNTGQQIEALWSSLSSHVWISLHSSHIPSPLDWYKSDFHNLILSLEHQLTLCKFLPIKEKYPPPPQWTADIDEQAYTNVFTSAKSNLPIKGMLFIEDYTLPNAMLFSQKGISFPFPVSLLPFQPAEQDWHSSYRFSLQQFSTLWTMEKLGKFLSMFTKSSIKIRHQYELAKMTQESETEVDLSPS